MSEETKVSEEKSAGKFEISQKGFLAVFLGIIFVVGAFQTFLLLGMQSDLAGQQMELNQLKSSGLAPAANLSAENVSAPKTESSGGLPANLQNLPDMVGGC